jgi:hypothetical protein
MKRIVQTLALCAMPRPRSVLLALLLGLSALCLAAGCSSAPETRYPWHGPLVDTNGIPVPEPSYEQTR